MDADWILHRSGLPWLKLDIVVPYREIFEESIRVRDRFVTHRYRGKKANWRAVCLHGISAEKIDSPSVYGFASERDAPYRWTDVGESCPATKRFVESLGYAFLFRVRWMILEPGAVVPPHRDYPKPSLSYLNAAIRYPKGCRFIVRGEDVPFEDGMAILLDGSNEHSVRNDSAEDRLHLVIHGDLASPQWKDLVERSYALSGRLDLNQRSSVPQTDGNSRLPHAPSM